MHLFGGTRDEWMAADMEGWLAPNRIYPGVADAVRALMQTHEVYIVTTKQVGVHGWAAAKRCGPLAFDQSCLSPACNAICLHTRCSHLDWPAFCFFSLPLLCCPAGSFH